MSRLWLVVNHQKIEANCLQAKCTVNALFFGIVMIVIIEYSSDVHVVYQKPQNMTKYFFTAFLNARNFKVKT